MKILFVDVWTKGVHNFLSISNELTQHGVKNLLVHTGSWGHDTDKPDEEVINGLLCRDIRYYKTRFIYRMLMEEKPDVVLILNTESILDRAIILGCRALGIRTAFLMHGAYLSDEEDIEKRKDRLAENLLRKRWTLVPKYLAFVLPNYFYSGFAKDRRFPLKSNPYNAIFNTFARPAQWALYPPPSHELQTDKCLVWSNIYKRLYMERYGYSDKDIEVVGHPNLDTVFQLSRFPPGGSDRDAFFRDLTIPADQPFVVYLEGGFVQGNVKGWTGVALMEDLLEIAQICEQTQRFLVIKLHPGNTSHNAICSAFANHAWVRICDIIDLPTLLYFSESAIGHVTTTIYIALVLQKPVFVPRWGISQDLPRPFGKHGVVMECASPNELRYWLSHPVDALQKTQPAVSKYIDEFITYTDGRTTDRIVNNLMKLGSQIGNAIGSTLTVDGPTEMV